MSEFPKLQNKEKVLEFPNLDLRNTDEVVKMVAQLQKADVIHDVPPDWTLEQCLSRLLNVIDQNVSGINGVGSVQDYKLYRLPDLSVARSEDNYVEYSLFTLDDCSFDYVTDINVSIFFEITKVVANIELYLECCRFAIYSKTEKISSSTTMVEFDLLHDPNLIPIRHTTWSSPVRIKLRCPQAFKVNEINISFKAIVAKTLKPKHWFCTPAQLPVVVEKGMCVFDRKRFMASIDPGAVLFYCNKE